jgi:hypothetical protein
MKLIKVLLFLLLLASSVTAATSWKSIKVQQDAGTVDLKIAGKNIEYSLIDIDEPCIVKVRGPRRIKIVTRAIGSSDFDYDITLKIDGKFELKRNLAAKYLRDNYSELRRVYVDIPAGKHTLEISSDNKTALRVFRTTKKKTNTMIALAPERFIELARLQFESGSQTVYYRFDDASPLQFEVTGPTTLEVWTRLDFAHTMNGTSNYEVDVLRDGESWRNFHFDTKKLSGASYVTSPELLPGSRRTIRIPVPAGRHRYEIKCAGPHSCGVTARIRIPEKDLNPGKK